MHISKIDPVQKARESHIMKKRKIMSINHIAIIPDGNGRWATKNNVPKAEGHKAGAENAKNIVEIAIKLGIKHLTLWGFSSENWRRTEEEVDALMDLMVLYLSSETSSLNKNNIKFNVK